MKKLISHILIALTGMLAVSCNAWLDVTPENAIADDDLFSTGFGYRNHLFQSTSMDGPWKERTFSGPNVKDGTDRPGARHGCIVKVNETVYQALLKAYKK